MSISLSGRWATLCALRGNIIAANRQGIALSCNSSAVLVPNNVWNNPDGNYVGLSAGPSDLSVDPLFVAGHYVSCIATGAAVNSPMLDAGPDTAAAAGLQGLTVCGDSVPDTGPADLGYHYPLSARPGPAQQFVPFLIR